MQLIPNIGLAKFKLHPTKKAQENPITCVLAHNVEAFYTVTPERMRELLQAHEALKRVTRSIHSMHEGGLINWAVMDTLQNSIDNIQDMPF